MIPPMGVHLRAPPPLECTLAPTKLNWVEACADPWLKETCAWRCWILVSSPISNYTSQVGTCFIHLVNRGLDSRVSSKQSNFFFGSNRNKPKLNLFRLFFGLFRETKKHFFRFVSVCFGVSDRYRNNRNKQNFLETNRNKPKNLQKTFSIRGSSKSLNFFLGSNRNKPKLNLFLLFFGLLFLETKFFFSVCFDVLDRYRNNRNKQNFWSRELKRLIF
jgi:hypothetical protein